MTIDYTQLFPVGGDVTHRLCPECAGDGRVEYERAVVDYQNGGYLEGYLDDCETCEGCGEIEIDYEKHCIVDEMGNLYWKPDERF